MGCVGCTVFSVTAVFLMRARADVAISLRDRHAWFPNNDRLRS